ncbi:MAG: hypothetical protein ABH952_05540 [Candidatus Omnitrophota bacterium]
MAGLNKKIWVKIIVICLVQAFILFDFSWAANGNLKGLFNQNTSVDKSTLAPSLGLQGIQDSVAMLQSLTGIANRMSDGQKAAIEYAKQVGIEIEPVDIDNCLLLKAGGRYFFICPSSNCELPRSLNVVYEPTEVLPLTNGYLIVFLVERPYEEEYNATPASIGNPPVTTVPRQNDHGPRLEVLAGVFIPVLLALTIIGSLFLSFFHKQQPLQNISPQAEPLREYIRPDNQPRIEIIPGNIDNIITVAANRTREPNSFIQKITAAPVIFTQVQNKTMSQQGGVSKQEVVNALNKIMNIEKMKDDGLDEAQIKKVQRLTEVFNSERGELINISEGVVMIGGHQRYEYRVMLNGRLILDLVKLSERYEDSEKGRQYRHLLYAVLIRLGSQLEYHENYPETVNVFLNAADKIENMAERFRADVEAEIEEIDEERAEGEKIAEEIDRSIKFIMGSLNDDVKEEILKNRTTEDMTDEEKDKIIKDYIRSFVIEEYIKNMTNNEKNAIIEKDSKLTNELMGTEEFWKKFTAVYVHRQYLLISNMIEVFSREGIDSGVLAGLKAENRTNPELFNLLDDWQYVLLKMNEENAFDERTARIAIFGNEIYTYHKSNMRDEDSRRYIIRVIFEIRYLGELVRLVVNIKGITIDQQDVFQNIAKKPQFLDYLSGSSDNLFMVVVGGGALLVVVGGGLYALRRKRNKSTTVPRAYPNNPSYAPQIKIQTITHFNLVEQAI